jgi:hypothetical protein
MIGNTAEAWSCCSSRSDGEMLRVWFSSSLLVSSEHGVKMTAALEVCTKDKQHPTVRLLASEGTKGAEIHRELAADYGQNCLSQWSVYEWIDKFKSSRTSVCWCRQVRTPIHVHRLIEHGSAQAMIFANCRVSTANISERLGLNVARPWCKPLV